MSESQKELLEAVPEPEKVRARLAENLQERDFLRRLLKVAEQKRRLQESAHA